MNTHRDIARSVTHRILLVLWPVLGLLILSACGYTPSPITATATFSGKDGLSRPATHSFSLTHDAVENITSRLATSVVPIYDVNDFELRVAREGLPTEQSFALVTVSQQHYAPGSDVPSPAVVGDEDYIRRNIGEVVRLMVDLDGLDSPLNDSAIDPFPNRLMSTGFTLLARWEADDPCMPFQDPNADTDVQRLAAGIFEALSDKMEEEDRRSEQFSLGGPDNDGDFQMFFVPYTQHSTRQSDGTPSNGFTFMFRATLQVGLLSTADVYIPLSFLFDRIHGMDSDYLEGKLDLLQFSDLWTEDRGRVTVVAEGFGAEQIARQVRDEILQALTSLPEDEQDDIDLKISLFSAALNLLRPDGGTGTLPETVRVVLFPTGGNGRQLNRVMPTAELRPRLCILD